MSTHCCSLTNGPNGLTPHILSPADNGANPPGSNNLGSSTTWEETTSCYGECNGHVSADPATNPDFHDANIVWNLGSRIWGQNRFSDPGK